MLNSATSSAKNKAAHTANAITNETIDLISTLLPKDFQGSSPYVVVRNQ